jgi:tryptophan synthase alpha chain
MIYLCSPTTTDARMDLIKKNAQGYLYYVSLKGVTGSNDFDLSTVKTEYLYRKTQSDLPMMVGFGIKTPEMAAQIADFADGVIVGAALINHIHQAYLDQQDSMKAGAELIHAMRQAMDIKG